MINKYINNIDQKINLNNIIIQNIQVFKFNYIYLLFFLLKVLL